MANQIVPCIYVDRFGREYRTRMNAEVLAQTNGADPAVVLVGQAGVGPIGSLPKLPSSVKPRRALMQSTTTNKQRYVTILDTDAPLWTTPGEELDIEDSDGASQTYTVRELINERFGRG